MNETPEDFDAALKLLEGRYKGMTHEQMAEEATSVARQQIQGCFEFKKPRLAQIAKYQALYDGKITKKLRQLFNVAIPVFPGMIDTLNAQYDTPIQMLFKPGDPADYFNVEKINGAFRMEIMNTNQNSKWDSKLRMARKHGIMTGRMILEYNVSSNPEYFSELNNINLKNFNFQPRGGLHLENHLFAGTEDVEKTKTDLVKGAQSGFYDKAQVLKLIRLCEDRDYLPDNTQSMADKLSRFKPLNLNPDNSSYVGESIYKLANHILSINGERYYLCFHPWTNTWLRFEKWTENGGKYPWVSCATHEDDENFLSKAYSDDLYPAADAIIAMFNQELTNREKRNFGARAYDKDMFPDVRKLDEAMHRPDALVPADTKGGMRRISEGIYEFKVGDLGGTVNLIDWITGSLGRNTGATDLAQGSTQEVSKKASVTFAEQKSVSKRIGWGAQPFQDMMGDLGNLYIWGLKGHMPAKMAIQVLGEAGYDWDEITRLNLNTKRDVNILIQSTEQQIQESEIKSKKRSEALGLVAQSQNINGKKRDEEVLRSVGGYEDQEIAEFLDVKTYDDRKALAKASESIQIILEGRKPLLWYGANIAFIQKITDFAADKRSTLGPKFQELVKYAMAHIDIARGNIERKVIEESRVMLQQTPVGGPVAAPGVKSAVMNAPENPGLSGGVSRALSIAEAA